MENKAEKCSETLNMGLVKFKWKLILGFIVNCHLTNLVKWYIDRFSIYVSVLSNKLPIFSWFTGNFVSRACVPVTVKAILYDVWMAIKSNWKSKLVYIIILHEIFTDWSKFSKIALTASVLKFKQKLNYPRFAGISNCCDIFNNLFYCL